MLPPCGYHSGQISLQRTNCQVKALRSALEGFKLSVQHPFERFTKSGNFNYTRKEISFYTRCNSSHVQMYLAGLKGTYLFGREAVESCRQINKSGCNLSCPNLFKDVCLLEYGTSMCSLLLVQGKLFTWSMIDILTNYCPLHYIYKPIVLYYRIKFSQIFVLICFK